MSHRAPALPPPGLFLELPPEDDPERPWRWRDGDDDLRPLDDEVGFPFDEYDPRPKVGPDT